jgi:hypothetical protein
MPHFTNFKQNMLEAQENTMIHKVIHSIILNERALLCIILVIVVATHHPAIFFHEFINETMFMAPAGLLE